MNHSARLSRLRGLLKTLPCDALLIEDPIDLLYLTGLELSSGKLIVSALNASLFVDGRYTEISRQQTLYRVELLKEDALQEWIAGFQIGALGFDQHRTTYHAFLSFEQMKQALSLKSRLIELVPVEQPILRLRLVKDEEEIQLLKKVARLGVEGYEYVASLLREGISEKELSFELEFFWKKKGASRLAFDPIIAFGPNSSMPHYRAGKAHLFPNTSVLIDIGAVFDHYNCDMTRVVYFGTPPPIMQTLYSIVEEAKERAIALCRPGVLVKDLDAAARSFIASKGYGDYFTHSLGHGIGLEVHEPPILRENGIYQDTPLEAGMAITIEPGIYLPEIGGVRLEDTLLITPDGYENLTA